MTIRQTGDGWSRGVGIVLAFTMRLRTWPVAALGLIGLVALVAVSLATVYDREVDNSGQLEQLNRQQRLVFSKLRLVRTDVYQSAIYVRDYLLDTERARDPEYREQLAAYRQSTRTTLAELTAMLPSGGQRQAAAERLRTSLDAYWRILDPLFFWTPAEKASGGGGFVRAEVLHRREEVLALAREIETLNDISYEDQRAEIVRRRAEFRQGLLTLLWQSLVLGVIVTVIVVRQLRVLERRAEEQRVFAEEAERRMRELSQEIVATQEEERRKLSRELHDQVGQMLTGLRMSLGRIERAGRDGAGDRFHPSLQDARGIVDDLTAMVRDLASGLRPSMLDDLGLAPALEWLGRDVSRRSGMPVDVSVDARVNDLPDAHRTCAYRVVQEALTNVVRHARASRAGVVVRREAGGVRIEVRDDGIGLPRGAETGERTGLGLRGLEERVKELAGSVHIGSGRGSGTTVTVHLPISEEVLRARPAG